MDLHDVGNYANNLIGSVIGRSEGFYDSSNADKTNENGSFAKLGAYFVFVILFIGIMIFANLYGSARLSWCYNTFYGVGSGEKIIWSFLCFLFSGFYYPFYAIFLDPVCGRVAQRGGRR